MHLSKKITYKCAMIVTRQFFCQKKTKTLRVTTRIYSLCDSFAFSLSLSHPCVLARRFARGSNLYDRSNVFLTALASPLASFPPSSSHTSMTTLPPFLYKRRHVSPGNDDNLMIDIPPPPPPPRRAMNTKHDAVLQRREVQPESWIVRRRSRRLPLPSRIQGNGLHHQSGVLPRRQLVHERGDVRGGGVVQLPPGLQRRPLPDSSRDGHLHRFKRGSPLPQRWKVYRRPGFPVQVPRRLRRSVVREDRHAMHRRPLL